MSYQQNQQKCHLPAKMYYQQNQQTRQLPAKCLPRCPPKWPPQTPQAPALYPRPLAPPASSHCPPTCCVSGFRGGCSLVCHGFPEVYFRQPQRSSCCENESSGSSSCSLSFRGCR